MIERLAPTDEAIVPCKVCGSPAAPFGAVDFARDCNVLSGKPVPLAGIPIGYHRCATCGLIFTVAFDRFTPDEFRTHIYNDGYPAVDPDYLERRPRANASMIQTIFGASPQLRILDYGGGNGLLCRVLRENGFANAFSFDPFDAGSASRPDGKFELIACFEVLEHTPTPRQTLVDMTSFLAPGGIILASTLLQPDNIGEVGMSWWYIAPRNGHVTLYSRPALEALIARAGLRMASFNDSFHLFFSTVPPFAKHLFG